MARIGLLLVGLAVIVATAAILESTMSRFRNRWALGAPIVIAMVIGFSVLAASFEGQDSDTWFVIAMIALGVPAIGLVVSGSRRAGQGREPQEPWGWTRVGSLVLPIALGGWLLMNTPQAAQQRVWMTAIALILPVLLASATTAFLGARQVKMRSLTLASSLGIIVLSWLCVLFGAASWTLIWGVVVAMGVTALGERTPPLRT